MLKISTALANHIAASGSIKDALDGFVVRVYSGTEPATANAALSGNTLLCELSVDKSGVGGTFDGTPVNGILSKDSTETWIGNIIVGEAPSFFRMVDPTDDGTDNASFLRVQGTVGTVGADFLVRSLDFEIGDEQRVDACNIGIPTSV